MKVHFWGTRGSLPIALSASEVRTKVGRALLAASGRKFENLDAAMAFAEGLPFADSRTYGGNSSCVQIDSGRSSRENAKSEYYLCDLGTGARNFGNRAVADNNGKACIYHIFISHPHWDHIMGFPLFTPAYLPGNEIRIYGCHTDLEAAFRRQHGAPSFPIDFSMLGADIEFIQLEAGKSTSIGELTVTPKLQLHSGDSYGYRFERGAKSVVYSTDAEHKVDNGAAMQSFVEFFRGADAVVFDAMYSLADAVSVKEDWGHSSNMVGVELCQLAGAKRLVLFHHEPVNNDAAIAKIEAQTQRLEVITRDDREPLQVLAAYDGLELEL